MYYARLLANAEIVTYGIHKGPITGSSLFAMVLTYVSYWLDFHEIIIKRLFFGNGVLEELYPGLQSYPLSPKNKGLEVWTRARISLYELTMSQTIREPDELIHVCELSLITSDQQSSWKDDSWFSFNVLFFFLNESAWLTVASACICLITVYFTCKAQSFTVLGKTVLILN